MTHTYAKGQGSRSLVQVETDRRIDRGDCITFHANTVGKNGRVLYRCVWVCWCKTCCVCCLV